MRIRILRGNGFLEFLPTARQRVIDARVRLTEAREKVKDAEDTAGCHRQQKRRQIRKVQEKGFPFLSVHEHIALLKGIRSVQFRVLRQEVGDAHAVIREDHARHNQEEASQKDPAHPEQTHLQDTEIGSAKE